MGGETRQRRRTLGGALVVLGLFGGALLVFFLEDIVSSFDSRYALVVVMERAPGIAEGTPVWVGGKQLGAVTSVALMPRVPEARARFAVVLDLPVSARPHVRADSDVRLTSATLIGEPVLDIAPGTNGARTLAAGDTLYMAQRLSAMELTRRAARVRGDLDTALTSLRALGPPVTARLEDTRRAFAGVDAALVEARALSAQVSASPGMALLRDPAFAASLDRTRTHVGELSLAMDAWRARMQEGGEAGAAVAGLRLRTDSLRAQLDGIAALLRTGRGSLGRFQSDSAIVRALDAARADLDSLIAQTRRNPLRFFF